MSFRESQIQALIALGVLCVSRILECMIQLSVIVSGILNLKLENVKLQRSNLHGGKKIIYDINLHFK